MIKVALYAWVSTKDNHQDPETQLMAMRDYCAVMGWEIADEYVDIASARDLAHRTEWMRLLDDAARHRFDCVLVFKLDRAFRSVKDLHDTLWVWDALGISFVSIREQFDTKTAIGRLLMNMLAAVAEFELEMIRERVNAGMDRARRQGKRIGRPKVTERRGFKLRFGAILARLSAGEISKRKAAEELGIGFTTFRRLLKAHQVENMEDESHDTA